MEQENHHLKRTENSLQIHEHYAKTNHKIEKLYHAPHHISLVTNDLWRALNMAGCVEMGSNSFLVSNFYIHVPKDYYNLFRVILVVLDVP